MTAGPALSGAAQDTASELASAVSVGASGADGGSATSVTLTVTVMVASTAGSGSPAPSLPSAACTVSAWLEAASKFSSAPDARLICPVESIANRAASDPVRE